MEGLVARRVYGICFPSTTWATGTARMAEEVAGAIDDAADGAMMHRILLGSVRGRRLPQGASRTPQQWRSHSGASTPEPEAGAQRGNFARWDLCGGPLARAVPTVINSPPSSTLYELSGSWPQT